MNQYPKCPECNSDDIISDDLTGDLICRGCAIVLGNILDIENPEYRIFSNDDIHKRVRVGAPTTLALHDKGLSTVIGRNHMDGRGNYIQAKKKSEIYRLQKWQNRLMTNKSVDRNLAYAMNELERLISQLNLSKNIKENAAHIYRKMVKKKLIRGRTIEAMLLASLYIACKLNKAPKTLEQLLDYMEVEKKKVGKCCRLIITTLKINVNLLDASHFVPQMCSRLKLDDKIQMRAIKLLNSMKKYNIDGGKIPTGLAGASIYIAALWENKKKTQNEISSIVHITEATVRNSYRSILEHLRVKIL